MNLTMTTRPSRERFVHRVDIQLQDTERKDRTGSLAPTSTTIRTDVPCVVTDFRGIRTRIGDAELQTRKVRVYFPDPIRLGTEHQIVQTTQLGEVRTLQVDACRDEQGLGIFWTADCTEQPAIIP